MCEHGRTIQTWRKFDAPKDYLACIAYIQQLVGQGQFELMAEESTCPLEKVKTEDGWADKIMAVSYTHLDVYKRQALYLYNSYFFDVCKVFFGKSIPIFQIGRAHV